MSIAVDSSAIVSIIKAEHESDRMAVRLGTAERRLMSAGTFMECGIVIGGQMGSSGIAQLRGLMASSKIELVAVTAEDAEIGLAAYRRFGKGSGHPARLNFGDCFSYALAKARNLPLLYKGDDFSHTDIVPALARG